MLDCIVANTSRCGIHRDFRYGVVWPACFHFAAIASSFLIQFSLFHSAIRRRYGRVRFLVPSPSTFGVYSQNYTRSFIIFVFIRFRFVHLQVNAFVVSTVTANAVSLPHHGVRLALVIFTVIGFFVHYAYLHTNVPRFSPVI